MLKKLLVGGLVVMMLAGCGGSDSASSGSGSSTTVDDAAYQQNVIADYTLVARGKIPIYGAASNDAEQIGETTPGDTYENAQKVTGEDGSKWYQLDADGTQFIHVNTNVSTKQN